MMSFARLFVPYVEGTAGIGAPPRTFLAAFVQRVRTGLLPRAATRRTQYVVVEEAYDHLRFRAASWWTAINVGLNDVELTVHPQGRVRYAIRYWPWTAYAVCLCCAVGAVMAGVFLAIDPAAYISQHAESRIPGFTIGQHVAFAWTMVAFWGFVWPWILIALHKRPLRRLMERIIADVDEGVPQ